MSELSSDEIRALLDAASPGPWHLDSHIDYAEFPQVRRWWIDDIERWNGYTNNVLVGTDEGTARLIAAAPRLATELLRLRELHGVLKAAYERARQREAAWTAWAEEHAEAIARAKAAVAAFVPGQVGSTITATEIALVALVDAIGDETKEND